MERGVAIASGYPDLNCPRSLFGQQEWMVQLQIRQLRNGHTQHLAHGRPSHLNIT
jgi:hypothetical protein